MGAPKNFAKFTGKPPSQSFFFIKAASSAYNSFKKETLPQIFSYGFCEIFKNTSRQILLAVKEAVKEVLVCPIIAPLTQ